MQLFIGMTAEKKKKKKKKGQKTYFRNNFELNTESTG